MANTQSEKPRKKRKVLEVVSADGDSKLARALGSVDGGTREQGLQALTLWLSRKPDLTELDLLKLWKGIFYAFWHSDLSPVQTALAERLSELLLVLPPETSTLYYAAFISTMRREWFGIDRLRMDKFMMLVRKFFFKLLQRLCRNKWQTEEVRELTSIWLEQVLLPEDTLAATGFAYHLIDLLIPELQRAVTSAEQRPPAAALAQLLEPFCQALARGDNPALLHRLRLGLFVPLIEEVQQPSELQPLKNLALTDFASHVFDLGADVNVKARNRQMCYTLSATLEKTKAGKPKSTAAAASDAAAAPTRPSTTAQSQVDDTSSSQPPAKAAKAAVAQAAAAATSDLVNGIESARKKQKKMAKANGSARDAPPAATTATPATPAKAKLAVSQKPKLGTLNGAKKAAVVGKPKDASPVTTTPSPEPASTNGGASPPAPLSTSKATAARQAPSTPVRAAPGSPTALTPETSKKNVRFSLKRNLVMTIGEPPAPSEVRTPPSSKPRGSALRKTSLLGSAPARLNAGSKSSKQGTPKRLILVRNGAAKPKRSSLGPQRPKAADFF